MPWGHKVFPGHLSNYEPDAFSANSRQSRTRKQPDPVHLIILPKVDRLKKFVQMLVDALRES